MEKPASPSTLLLTLVLLLHALLLQARELGGSYEQHVRSPLVLPASSDEDDGVVVPPELNALPGVGRPGGGAPPAPQWNPSPHQRRSPPSPEGNTPSHYRRSGPAAGVLDAVFLVLRDALVRYGVGA